VSSCHLGQGAAGAAALKTQAVSRSHMVEGKVVVPAPSKLAHARDTPEVCAPPTIGHAPSSPPPPPHSLPPSPTPSLGSPRTGTKESQKTPQQPVLPPRFRQRRAKQAKLPKECSLATVSLYCSLAIVSFYCEVLGH